MAQISKIILPGSDEVHTIKDNAARSSIIDIETSKQDSLVSGVNIKTINNQSILGDGNISIENEGSSRIPVIDFTNDTTGNYILLPQVLYLLPNTNSIESDSMNIVFNNQDNNSAGIWRFIVNIDLNIQIALNDVEFASLPSFMPGSVYLFEIVAAGNKKYGTFRALSQPETYYLYDSSKSIPTCDESSGGWNFNGVGMFNGTTQRISIVQANDASDPNCIKMAAYRDNNGNRYGNTISTKQRVSFKTLYDAGYRSIKFTARSDKSAANCNFYFIVCQNIFTVNGNNSESNISANFQTAFPGSVYLKINNPSLVYVTYSIQIKQIIDAGINNGYVAVFHHADNSGTYNGYIKQIYADRS